MVNDVLFEGIQKHDYRSLGSATRPGPGETFRPSPRMDERAGFGNNAG
jgi:hypothetical protein